MQLAWPDASGPSAGTRRARRDETGRRLRHTETLLSVAQSLADSLDLAETLRRVARVAGRALGAETTGAYLADPEGHVLRPLAGHHVPKGLLDDFLAHPVPLTGHALVEQAWADHRAAFSADPRADARIDPSLLQRFPVRSVLFVPMVARGRPLGGLFVLWWTRPHVLASEELRLADAIGRQAGLAVANAQLFEASERRRKASESVMHVGRLLSRSLDPEDVARQIADSVRVLLHARTSTIYRLDPASGDLQTLSRSGDLPAGLPPRLVFPRGVGVASLAVRERAPVTTRDLLQDARVALTPEIRAWIEQVGYRAVLALPLVVEERVIGALALGDRAERAFDAEDVRLAETFAAHAAIALDKARLFQEVREGRDFLRSITENSADAIVAADVHGRISYFSPGAEETFGYRADEVLGQACAVYYGGGRAEARTLMRRLETEGRVRNYDTALRAKDGRWVEVSTSISCLHGAGGAVAGTMAVIRDVSEHRHAQETLRLRDRAIEAISQGIALSDPWRPDNPIGYANRAFAQITGYEADEVVGHGYGILAGPDTDPDALDRLRVAARAEDPCTVTTVLYRKDRQPFWGELALSPLRDARGAVTHFVGVLSDVTERRQLEGQLRQAQKMEAVGRLAGGVAHDFNNLLTIISGRNQLVLGRLGADDPLRRHAAVVGQTVDRGAALTRQLLALSRQQVLQPKVLDLNRAVAGIETILRRLIAENVELVTRLEPGLGPVKADPGQLDQVLLNLVVNARDAMPRGGRLTIETANVDLDEAFTRHHPGTRPGPHVRLAVSDTGVGMDDATRARIFEPFFTTKEPGKGTGLGLATVYGIVAQSKGCLEVLSEPGRGARFEICLPRVEAPVAPTPQAGDAGAPPRGAETVLLAEDEAEVRALAREILQGSGYTILEARHGVEALRVAERHEGPIHLLLTDVVMPELGGRALAESLAPLRPELAVLYMSGHIDDALVHQHVREAGVPFLQKPFTPDGLAGKVRQVLDARRERAASPLPPR